jgi:hypothetical protein
MDLVFDFFFPCLKQNLRLCIDVSLSDIERRHNTSALSIPPIKLQVLPDFSLDQQNPFIRKRALVFLKAFLAFMSRFVIHL